jgi:hypothetical protein
MAIHILPWLVFKAFVNSSKAQLFYFEFQEHYQVIAYCGPLVASCDLYKDPTDPTDLNEFIASYLPKCNINEASRTRLTTNKIGRRLHDRYIFFVTSDQDNFDNTDKNDVDFNDVTYEMYDINKALTTNNALAKETHIIFEPHWNFEIFYGMIKVPESLTGDQNSWEAHAVGAPDIPRSFGGDIDIIANPKLKCSLDKWVGKSVLNPAEMEYSATLHSNKIKVIVKHPVGEQCEFQINLAMFK